MQPLAKLVEEGVANMVEPSRERVGWLPALQIWRWLAIALVCIGCQQAPSPAPFHRFVEGVVPGDRWHETKVAIGVETRNVLYAPYRGQLKQCDVAEDGTIPLGAVAEIDKISSDAPGISIKVDPLPSPEQSTAGQTATHVYVPMPVHRDVAALAETKVDVLPVAEAGRRVQASARAVVTLPREHVTETVSVPQAARLDFGIGIEGEESDMPLCTVRFSVEVDRDGERQLIFSQALEAKASGDEWGWMDVSLDLSDLAGSSVRFVFRTDSVYEEEGTRSKRVVPLFACSPVWSSPILYTAEAEIADNRPNVILISLDTLRADHLGCYGYHRNTSPNIDKFAEESLLFENCIAPSSWTLPSHASVFTGLYPSVHGAVLYTSGPPIKQTETTLAELAREHGYLTAAYTEGVLVAARLGFAQGFELYSDGDLPPDRLAEETFNRALEWIRTYKELPFLMFVHTYQTHLPYMPPERFATLFDSDYTGPVGSRWDGVAVARVMARDALKDLTDADKKHIEALYDGEIAYTDEVVGNFMDQLRQMRLLDNSVVVIFSDHGEEFWEHGSVQHGLTLYDEQLRVPLIIRLPGGSHPVGHVTRQVALMDLYATVVEILGIDRSFPTGCMSLAPLMRLSKSRRGYDRQSVISELYPERESGRRKSVGWWTRSARTDDGKYIVSDKSETEELYNLRSDPGEANNIAAEDKARLKHYQGLLEAFLKDTAEHAAVLPTDTDTPPLSEEDRRQLRAFGYM